MPKCSNCGGGGYINSMRCETCNGSGWVTWEQQEPDQHDNKLRWGGISRFGMLSGALLGFAAFMMTANLTIGVFVWIFGSFLISFIAEFAMRYFIIILVVGIAIYLIYERYFL